MLLKCWRRQQPPPPPRRRCWRHGYRLNDVYSSALEPDWNFTSSTVSFRAFSTCFLMDCLNGTPWDASWTRLRLVFTALQVHLGAFPLINSSNMLRNNPLNILPSPWLRWYFTPTACYHFQTDVCRIIILIHVTTSTAAKRWWSFALHDDEWRANT